MAVGEDAGEDEGVEVGVKAVFPEAIQPSAQLEQIRPKKQIVKRQIYKVNAPIRGIKMDSPRKISRLSAMGRRIHKGKTPKKFGEPLEKKCSGLPLGDPPSHGFKPYSGRHSQC